MPSRSDPVVSGLLLLVELTAAFSLLVGTGTLETASTPYSIFWALLLAGALGIALAHLVARLQTRGLWSDMLIVAGAVLAVGAPSSLLISNTVTLATASGLLLLTYGRAVFISREAVAYDGAYRRFLVGSSALLVSIVWIVARGFTYQQPIWNVIGLSGIGFMVAAMAALTTVRLERRDDPAAAQSVFISVGLQLGVLLLLSLAALAFFSLNVLGWLENGSTALGYGAGWLAHAVPPVWNALVVVITTAFRGVAGVVQWLTAFVHSHAHPLHRAHGRPQAARRPPIVRHGAGHPSSVPTIPAWAILMGALVLVGFAALLWRSRPASWRRPVMQDHEEEGSRSWSGARFWEGVRDWLRGLLAHGTEGAGQVLHAAGRRILGPTYPADPVRRVYAQLLYRAEVRGLSRHVTATPWEFQMQLETRWPNGAEHIAALTEAYVYRRYNEASFGDEERDDLERHWRRLRGVMREGQRFTLTPHPPLPRAGEGEKEPTR